MRILTIILLLFSLSGYSQSVHIDGATGRVSDLPAVTSADSADYVILEHSDSSKRITVGNLHTYSHDMGSTYLSTEGTQTIGTGGTFEKLFEGAMAYTGLHLTRFTESNGRLTYTGATFDHFLIICTLTVEAGETAQRVQFRLAQDGTTIAGTNQSYDFTATTIDCSISLNWVTELATNGYIEVFGTSDTNGDTFDIHNLTLSVFKH